MTKRLSLRISFLMALMLTNLPAVGQEIDYIQEEMPNLPAPDWVEMRELDDESPVLKGMRVPKGVHVEVVASEPALIDPVGMTFGDDGSLYVLEWRSATEQIDVTYDVHYQDGTVATVNRKKKNVDDQLKQLFDTNGDGRFDTAQILMDDLEMPSSVLLHEGWMYFPSMGHVIRRRPNPVAAGWIEEEILRGMCGYHHHQVSGLTLSHDNWLYTTTGDDDNIAEGIDGSRATVLRTGAIFRSRPDGSQLNEFARGFRNPYRNVVFDEHYNLFHVDNDQEDGSKFQGVRLMHLLEGADYGWRLEMGAKCCRTDFARGAVFGERPGKMPSMLKTGRGAPAGLLIYQGNAFPESFRGLLIYPDVYRMKVRAYEVERKGSTFRVVRQFVLMESDSGLFRPVQAATGPDGAIYILDWATNSGGAGRSWGDTEHGRLYRLTWSGHAGMPARQRGSLQAWNGIDTQSTESLNRQFVSTRDFELRERIQRELVRRGSGQSDRFAQIVLNPRLPLPARASSLGAASRRYDDSVHELMLEVLAGDHPFELQRLAADAISHHMTPERATRPLATALLKAASSNNHPAVKRSAALALGRLGSLIDDSKLAEDVAGELWGQLQLTSADDPFLYDGFVRALERCEQAGMQQLVSAVTGDDADERELATSLFPALRTRAAAEALDQLLGDDLSELNETQLSRLLSTHRHILVHPPIKATAVQRWLQMHPDASPQLQVTAMQTLALVGGGGSPAVTELALQLIRSDESDIQMAAIEACGNLRIIKATPSLYELLWESESREKRQAIIQAMALLRAEDWPYADRSDPGVELILGDLLSRHNDIKDPEVQADVLWLAGEIDFAQAEPLALAQLAKSTPGDDLQRTRVTSAAIELLARKRDSAIEIGRRFLANQLPSAVKSQVVAGLQQHLTSDTSGAVGDLLNEIFRDGLTISLEPEQLAATKRLVLEKGDPKRGRDVFLDRQKSQCITCHRIEGVGGIIGPDLNKIWQTHTVEKIIESIVDPSREIKEGFESWTVTTTSGQVYGGLKLSDGPPKFIVRSATGRDHRIPLEEIDYKEASKRSLMPEQIVSQLTLTEFLDLIAFLKDEDAQKELKKDEG